MSKYERILGIIFLGTVKGLHALKYFSAVYLSRFLQKTFSVRVKYMEVYLPTLAVISFPFIYLRQSVCSWVLVRDIENMIRELWHKVESWRK